MSIKEERLIGMENTLGDLLKLDNAMLIPCGVAYDVVYKHKDLTMKEVLETKPFNSDGWGYWIMLNMSQYFEADVRLEFIKKVNTEMRAFQLYINRIDLTEDEDELLRSKFEGKLPTAEKELRDKLISRKKNG